MGNLGNFILKFSGVSTIVTSLRIVEFLSKKFRPLSREVESRAARFVAAAISFGPVLYRQLAIAGSSST